MIEQSDQPAISPTSAHVDTGPSDDDLVLRHRVENPIAAKTFDAYRRLKTPIWVHDIDRGQHLFANLPACAMWKAENEADLLCRTFEDMSTTVHERLRQYQKSFVSKDKSFSELWTLFPKGAPVHVKITYTGFPLDDGRMAMMCEALSDLEEEPETVRSAQALMHTDVMITLFDAGASGAALYSNPSSMRSLIETDDTFSARINNDAVCADIFRELAEAGECDKILQVRTAIGDRWHNMSIKSCFDAVTGDDALLVTEVDVTEMRAVQERESYLAVHDALTGLRNRAYIQNFIENAQAFKAELADLAAVFYIDIDRFKQINDTLGHEVGDAVLVKVAERIRSEIKAVDVVARLGGDEFIVLIKGRDQDLDEIACRIRESVCRPIGCRDRDIVVSCSIGIARYPLDGEQFDGLMRHADLALYAAKNAGRKTHRYFQPVMEEEAARRQQLESELELAMDRGEFELYYQPRAEVASNRIVGVEALVRWNNPNRGLILPGEFIPLCEETGMIERLGETVLTTAALQQASWLRDGHDIFVSANLSPRQFNSERLLPLMREIARYPGVTPSRIEFEITETVLMGDSELVLATLTEIQSLGFNMALDDFGTGYSNLAYIPKYPIGCLKIDKTFIEQLPHSSAVIGLILSLGNQIGAKVVAEGVETLNQLDQLHEWECPEYQGFLFERPQTAAAITAILEQQALHGPIAFEDLSRLGQLSVS